MMYLLSVWQTDWVRVVNSMAVTTDEKGRRCVSFETLVALNDVPLCQIRALQDDPRGKHVSQGELNMMISERRKRSDQEKAPNGIG